MGVDADYSPSALTAILSARLPDGLTGRERLKMTYRPYTCPFGELLHLIPLRSSVADIGCGNGTFLTLVAATRAPTRLYGTEISPRLIQNAEALLRPLCANTPLELEVYNGRTLPESIAEFDVVTLVDVLHHVPLAQHEAFLLGLFRHMRPGATLIVKDIDAERGVLVHFNKLHDLVFSGEIGNELGAKDMKQRLDRAGFITSAVSRRRMLVYPHFTITCVKPT